VPDLDEDYLFNRDTTLAILAGFAFNRRVMITGYHGTGKSTHIEQVAARLNWPCIRINLDSHISRIDLIGKDAIVLQDGKQVKVTRRYAVHSAPVESGFLLDGKLVDVSVDVPPLLGGLAEIERKRVETGMFPVRIDSSGTILAGQQDGQFDRRLRDEMTARASVVLAETGMPKENLQLGTRFVSQTMQAPPRSSWPVDLFKIQPGEHRQSRIVALAGGAEGRIEVVTRVDSLLPCGLPRTIERTVVTILAGSRRVSREIWAFQTGNP